VSQISLRPVASPLSTFTPAEVRGNASSGSDLIQLGSALKEFNTGLGQYMSVREAQYRQQAAADAQKVMLEKQFKNMADLKSAVDRGEISENDNPWRFVFLKQLVASKEVGDVSRQIEDEYYKTPELRWTNDTERVDQFISSRMSQAFAGRDAWETSVVTQQASEWRQRFLSAHADRRRGERELETQAGVVRGLTDEIVNNKTALSGVSFEPGTAGQIVGSQALAKVQGIIDAAYQGAAVHPEKLRAWATTAVIKAADAAEDPQLAMRMLENLKVDGQSLKSALAADDLKKVSDEILTRQVQKERLALEKEELAQRRLSKEALGVFLPLYNKGIPLSESHLTDFNGFQNLSAESQLTVRGIFKQVQAMQAEALVGSASAVASSGDFNDEAKGSYLALASMLGASGKEAARQVMDIDRVAKANLWGQTSPDTSIELQGLLTERKWPALVSRVNQLAASAAISKEDFDRYHAIVAQGTNAAPEIFKREDVVSDIAVNRLIDYRRGSTDEQRIGWDKELFQEQLSVDINALKSRLAEFTLNWHTSHPAGTEAEFKVAAESEATRLLTTMGVDTTPKGEAQLTQTKAQRAVLADTSPAVWKDGTIHVQQGGSMVPLDDPPSFFNGDSKQFMKGWKQKADALKITTPQDRQAFAIQQIKKLRDGQSTAAVQVREEVLKESLGDKTYSDRLRVLDMLRERASFYKQDYGLTLQALSFIDPSLKTSSAKSLSDKAVFNIRERALWLREADLLERYGKFPSTGTMKILADYYGEDVLNLGKGTGTKNE